MGVIAPLTPGQIVNRVLLAVVKSRSNAAESGSLELAEDHLNSRLWGTGPMSVFEVCGRVLAKGEAHVEAIDVINVCAHLRHQEGGELIYYLRWQSDLPTPVEVMTWASALEA